MGRAGGGCGGSSGASACSTAALIVTEKEAETWRRGSLSPSGKSLELFSYQGNWANMADGQE